MLILSKRSTYGEAMSTEAIKTIGQLKKAIKNLKDDAKLFINEDGLLYSFWRAPAGEDDKTITYETVIDNIGLVHNPTIASNDGELY